MADLVFLLQHGWAFDASTWRAWENLSKRLAPTAKVSVAERGYFSASPADQSFLADRSRTANSESRTANPESPESRTTTPESRTVNSEICNTSTGRRKILVVHSLGLHLVSESLLDGSDLLVIIGGFVHFHDGTDRDARMSKLAVRRMIQKLDREPQQVVADFYENCGLPENYSAAQLTRLKNLALLKSDLELLDQSALDQKQLLKPKEILILHGEQDSIAPVHHAASLKKLRPDAVVAIHSQASHALPYDYPEWCLQQIESSLMVPGR